MNDTTTNPAVTTDLSGLGPLEAYTVGAEQLAAVIERIDPGQATLPTPCTEWDVAHLVGHVLFGLDRIRAIGAGEDPFAIPAIDVPADGSPWVDQVRAGIARALDAWADRPLDSLVTVPWGQVPGSVALTGYLQEVCVHAWDVVVATGQGDVLDPALAELALGGAGKDISDAARGDEPGFPFGTIKPAPADAGPYERLAAHTGRTV